MLVEESKVDEHSHRDRVTAHRKKEREREREREREIERRIYTSIRR